MSVSFKPNEKEDDNDDDDNSVTIMEDERKYTQLSRYTYSLSLYVNRSLVE